MYFERKHSKAETVSSPFPFPGADGQAVLREAISVFHTDGDVMDSKSDVIPTGRDVKVSVESRVDQKRDWLSFVNFRVTTRDGAYPKLDLLDDSSTWRPG